MGWSVFRKRSTYELMIHHGLVIMCFIIAVSTRQYVAYGGLSLAVEINSVFLHMRQLFIITEESKSSFRYKVNAVLNVATFLVFRIYVFRWMTRQAFHNIKICMKTRIAYIDASLYFQFFKFLF